MKTSAAGIALIEEFEGFRAQAYRDPVGIWTIGYGFTRGVEAGDRITRAQADDRLRAELATYEAGVWRATGGNVTQAQFDALVSFAWNVGIAGMTGSSVVKAHNRGDYQAAARAFALWNKAGGKVWPGLTRRRAAEAALYLSDAPADMPQAVEPERPITASSINRAGVAAGGTAVVATVAETARTVSDIKSSVDSLGDWLLPVLLVAVAGLCAYIVWERVRVRREGWS
ncbi:lysozyme [Paracidovorax citrulli]|uniref:lysozyme n=1 Tax=Paracidovorax citrulli TaxID=80869 RepID=UPI0005FC1EB7|nr:lysozyme [Paracidovorax citrulli]